jgi:hypothetical protein
MRGTMPRIGWLRWGIKHQAPHPSDQMVTADYRRWAKAKA